ncbi:MAG: hypothetical protein RJQ09_15000 [Cyclobacteriaceae bacterium]
MHKLQYFLILFFCCLKLNLFGQLYSHDVFDVFVADKVLVTKAGETYYLPLEIEGSVDFEEQPEYHFKWRNKPPGLEIGFLDFEDHSEVHAVVFKIPEYASPGAYKFQFYLVIDGYSVSKKLKLKIQGDYNAEGI